MNKKINQYEWDLESILKNQTLEELYNQWKNKMNLYVKTYSNFYSSMQKFKQYCKLELQIDVLQNRLFNYIGNNLAENNSSEKWNGWEQKISYDCQHYSKLTSDSTNIILDNQKQIEKYLLLPEFKKYQREYDLIFKSKKHILDKQTENTLSKIGINNSASHNIFNALTTSDIKYKDAIDSKNNKIKINTISDVTKNLKSNDKMIRKSTWISFNNAYYEIKNTLTKTLYHNYLMLNSFSKLRNYQDYLDASIDADEIDLKLIKTIYQNVAKYKTIYNQYLTIRNLILKKQLKVTKIEPWDKSVDLAPATIKISKIEAKEHVLNALKPFGDEYLNNVKKAFDENWISWLAKKDKQPGAYSIGGSYGLDKMYISMNYDDSINAVSTLIHELGHSMHSYYFNKSQDIYADCSIFYAEISSIVNEVLLSYYWLEKYKDDKIMLNNILDHILSEFFATTTRQIIFSNFEMEANQLINEQKPFVYDTIQSLYLKMIDLYEGLDDQKRKKILLKPYCYGLSTILRISHFYAGNFYVYKYSIGQIVAIIVADKIYKNDKQAIANYFKFLKSGSSLSPLDTIKLLGVDLYDQNIYSKAKDVISNFILKFKSNNK